jgi:hypothetical protein
MKTVTHYGWELARPGNWRASQGNGTLTETDLKAMVDFAGHTEADKVKVKIGHRPAKPGEPNYGLVRALRVVKDDRGPVLIGDLEVPVEVDAAMKVAYPDRSIEFSRGYVTSDGKRHPAKLTAVALLGVEAPAVKGLNDLVPADVLPDQVAASEDVETVVVEFAEGPITTTPPTGGHGEGDATTRTKEGPVATLTAEQLKTAGLTDEQIAALTKLSEEAATVEKAAADKAEADAAAEKAKTDAELAEKAKKDAEVPVKTVTLTEGQYADLVAGAKAGQAAATQLAEAQRTDLIAQAVRDGKIAPAEQAAFAELPLDTVRNVLAKLTPGKIPVGEKGGAGQADNGKPTELSDADFAPVAALFGLN